MNNSQITIFLRRTNGKGEKVQASSDTTIDELYNSVSTLFNLELSSFILIFYGSNIEPSKVSLLKTGIELNSIIHIVEPVREETDISRIKISFVGSLYEYENNQNSSVAEIKDNLRMQAKKQGQIIITYQGRFLSDEETMKSVKYKKQDILSAIFCQRQSVEIPMQKVHTKMVQSVTIATSENNQTLNEITPRQYLRKSSMKSSHESRERKDSNINSESGRSKSQAEKNKQCEDNKQVQLLKVGDLSLKTPWLINQKFIQTESISCEDEYMDQPELWTSCFVSFRQNNFFYKLECTERHKWFDVKEKIQRIFFVNHRNSRVQIVDSPFTKELKNSSLMLQLAKQKGEQYLPEIQIRL